jgi:hypothetical protein
MSTQKASYAMRLVDIKESVNRETHRPYIRLTFTGEGLNSTNQLHLYYSPASLKETWPVRPEVGRLYSVQVAAITS